MFFFPAVVVHGLDDARHACAPGLPVTLLSAPDAALFAGCGWWRAVIAAIRAERNGAGLPDILDCGDAPGAAMAALSMGQSALVLDPACPGFPAVSAAAAVLRATVLAARPAALDLAAPGARRRLEAWLRATESNRDTAGILG